MSAVPLITFNDEQLIFKGVDSRDITHAFIFSNSSTMPDSGSERFFSIHPEMIRVNDEMQVILKNDILYSTVNKKETDGNKPDF